MKIGMLWFDNSKSPLAAKVQQAAEYYQKKYGKSPNYCQENPKDTSGEMIGGIKVEPNRSIPPGHLWVGWED